MKTLSFILSTMDNTLKKVIKRQIPYLIGGAITGAFLAYYFGFLASFVVNTIVWTGVSIVGRLESNWQVECEQPSLTHYQLCGSSKYYRESAAALPHMCKSIT